MTKDRMRPIRLFERLSFFCAQFDIHRFEDLLQVMCFSRPDYRCSNARSLQYPCARDLGGRDSVFLCDLLSYRSDLEVIVVEVHLFLHLVGLCALGRSLPRIAFAIAFEKSACQRTPGNKPDT
jgi:hypothetical protein